MDVFKKQIEIIKRNNFEFFDPKNFSEEFNKVKTDKKILITIDDAFLSFYENAWPFLKENQIPFILFTSTDFIGKKGYMNIDQLREVEKESFAYLGNHSHMHEYMVTFDFNKFTNDIDRSIEIFNDLFNYNPIFFSYPFGEYSLEQKNYIVFLEKLIDFREQLGRADLLLEDCHGIIKSYISITTQQGQEPGQQKQPPLPQNLPSQDVDLESLFGNMQAQAEKLQGLKESLEKSKKNVQEG